MSSSEPMTPAKILKLLKRDKKKKVCQTIENCLIVLRNDPVLKGAIRHNLLTDRQDIVRDVGWARSETSITDTDLQYLLHYFENNYSLSVEKKILSAITIIANENRFHPIQDYLLALQWDGVERLPHALPKYLGAEACDYTTEVLKVFMLGAVSRVFQPGCKFDYMLCLVGGQGAGKSTFFRFLAIRDRWFTDDMKSVESEEIYEQMSGHFIIEMPEMLATASAKFIEAIKSFISRQSETYRTRYERYPKDRPRQCVFGGTSNSMDFLPLDRSGNRRFLPVPVDLSRAQTHLLDNEPESRAYFDQLWAEVMAIYRKGGFSLTLSPEIEKEAIRMQRSYMPEDSNVGIIQQFLDTFKGAYVCSRMLHEQALGRGFAPKSWETKEINEIMNNSVTGWEKCGNHRFADYGTQRAWRRIPTREPVVEQLEIRQEP